MAGIGSSQLHDATRNQINQMSIEKQIEAFNTALNTGNIVEATRLANIIDFVASAPIITTRSVNTTASDNAARRTGFDYEQAILSRQESALATY
jgi:hypothetical protein